MKNVSLPFILLLFASIALFSQTENQDNISDLRLVAAEALIKLGRTSEATYQLNAVRKDERNYPWKFLSAANDQSIKLFTANNNFVINDIKLSNSGKLLAAAASDSTICIFDYPSMDTVYVLKGHKSSVSTVTFSVDDKFVASGGRDHRVIIWKIADGTMILNNDSSFSQGIYQLRFSPDSKTLGVVSWERNKKREPGIFGYAKFLDTETGATKKHFELDNHPASCVTFSKEENIAFVASWGEIIYKIKLDTDEIDWRFDLSDPESYNAFYGLELSPDGKTLAATGADFKLRLFDASDGKETHIFDGCDGHGKPVKTVKYAPDGKMIATAGEDLAIIIHDPMSGETLFRLTGHTATISQLQWTPDGKALLSCANDGSIRLWKLDETFQKSFEICNYGPWQTPLSPERKFFVAPCSDTLLQIIDIEHGEVEKTLGNYSGLCAAYRKDGKILYTASFDGIVRKWNLVTGEMQVQHKEHSARVDGIASLSSSNMVLSVGDNRLIAWNESSNAAEAIIQLTNTPFRILVSPDEKYIIIGFNNGNISILNTKDFSVAKELHSGNSLQEIAVSNDANKLAVFSGKEIHIIELSGFTTLFKLGGHSKSGYGIDFSPDGSHLISCSSDQLLKFWDLSTGKCVLSYHIPQAGLYNCKWIDKQHIVTSTSQGKIYKFSF